MTTLLEIFKTMDYGPAPESPAAVNAWLDEHGRKFGLFINNKWVQPEDDKNLPQLSTRPTANCWRKPPRRARRKSMLP